jgi:hypothetical protein
LQTGNLLFLPVANNIPLHALLFQWKAMHGPIELILECSTTGKGSFWMTDEYQQASNSEIADASQQTPHGEMADGSQLHPSGAILKEAQQDPSGEAPQPAANQAFAYASIAVALGLLVGVAFAVIALRSPSRSGPRDLGPVISDADGLKGHLILSWDETFKYHLVVEPSDPARHAEFSLAVSSPPRPLSFNIQLKDLAGSLLCTKNIVLRYDPRQAAALADSDGRPQAVHASAGNGPLNQNAQAIDIAQSEALELQREHGQDIFQNDIGQDGESTSISSLGVIPCSRQEYEHTASWGFSPDFLTLNEQAELLKRQANLREDASTSPAALSAGGKATRKKEKKKVPENLATFAIEGDDELIGYDPSKGLIETRARKAFLIDRANGAFNAAAWEDVPANIHYKCDLKAACTLSRRGATVLYARLMR